jgi:hypothetical protein
MTTMHINQKVSVSFDRDQVITTPHIKSAVALVYKLSKKKVISDSQARNMIVFLRNKFRFYNIPLQWNYQLENTKEVTVG